MDVEDFEATSRDNSAVNFCTFLSNGISGSPGVSTMNARVCRTLLKRPNAYVKKQRRPATGS